MRSNVYIVAVEMVYTLRIAKYKLLIVRKKSELWESHIYLIYFYSVVETKKKSELQSMMNYEGKKSYCILIFLFHDWNGLLYSNLISFF